MSVPHSSSVSSNLQGQEPQFTSPVRSRADSNGSVRGASLAHSKRASSLTPRSLSQASEGLGIQPLNHRRDSEPRHTRTSSGPSSRTNANDDSSPKIPELSPRRLSRQFNTISFHEDVDSPRLSIDFSRPTPPLQSPSRASARHSRTLSSSSSTSILRSINNGSDLNTSRSHSRQLSSVSLQSNSSDPLHRPSQELLARSLQPRQYNYPENDSTPLDDLTTDSSPEEQGPAHTDVRKAPPMINKRHSRQSQILQRQSVPPSPLREHTPQMTSVWLDDDFSKLNRSRSSVTKPARPAHSQGHRKHASVSESPQTPMSPSTSRRQSKILAPSDASTRLAAATSSSASPVEQSPKSRTPKSFRRLLGSLSPLRFSSRRSASPPAEPAKSKQKSSKASTPPVASSEPVRTPKSLQSAIDLNGAHRNLARPRPTSMVQTSPRPVLASPLVPGRPARPSPKELPDATDMRRLSTDFNRRSIVFTPSIPQSPTFMTSPQSGFAASPKIPMTDRRCISTMSTSSNESDPSTHAGSRTSLLVDGSLASRSPRVPPPADLEALRIRSDSGKQSPIQDPRVVSASSENWI